MNTFNLLTFSWATLQSLTLSWTLLVLWLPAEQFLWSLHSQLIIVDILTLSSALRSCSSQLRKKFSPCNWQLQHILVPETHSCALLCYWRFSVSGCCHVKIRAFNFPDEVNLAELPSLYQAVWSASFCQMPSLYKWQQSVSLWYWSQRDAHLFCRFRMMLTWAKHIQKGSYHDWEFSGYHQKWVNNSHIILRCYMGC